MAESKCSVTLLQQRKDVAFTTDKPYSIVQQRQILTRKVYCHAMDGPPKIGPPRLSTASVCFRG